MKIYFQENFNKQRELFEVFLFIKIVSLVRGYEIFIPISALVKSSRKMSTSVTHDNIKTSTPFNRINESKVIHPDKLRGWTTGNE